MKTKFFRSKIYSSFLIPVLAFCFLVLAVSGCRLDEDNADIVMKEDSSHIIMGWVFAEEPILDAHVTAYDMDGEQIGDTEIDAAGVHGSFLFEIKNLPLDFRVIAHEGTHKGDWMSHNLVADIRNYQDTDVIYVNVVTTIISAYLDKHPEMTLDDARAMVKGFLDVPDWVDLARITHATDEFFSHAKFMIEAELNGGLTVYIDQLTDQMDGEFTQTFADTVPNYNGNGAMAMPMLGGGVGSFIGENLAAGALRYVGGNLLGLGLSEIGLGFGDSTETMQKSLIEMSKKLDLIDLKMIQLSQEMKQTDYDTLMAPLGKLFSSIKITSKMLANLVSSSHANIVTAKSQKNEIITMIREQIVPYQELIHTTLIGANGKNPALKLWSQLVKGNHRFLSKGDSASVQSQFDYCDRMQGWLCELVIEYLHAIGRSSVQGTTIEYSEATGKDTKDAYDLYKTNYTTQKEMLLPAIPDGIFIDKKQHLMIWLPDNYYADMTFNLFSLSYAGGMSMTFADGIAYVYNATLLGYIQWRFPTPIEMRNMFTDTLPPGTSFAQYAKDRGFAIMEPERYIASSYQSIWDLHKNHWSPWISVYAGHFMYSNDEMWSWTDIASIYFKNTLTIMPVRKMEAAEYDLSKYFY